MHRYLVMLFAALVVSGCSQASQPGGGGAAVVLPAPAYDPAPHAPGLKKAVLAGGCFWGVQAVYQHLAGVKNAVSGYSGGGARDANYPAVSRGNTGHAESVEIVYDPSQVSYGQLLQVFFAVVHDPTQLNRQGPDVGPQYRSAIFYADAEQKKVAEAYIAQLTVAKAFTRPIVTRVDALAAFHAAEDYHQDYLLNNPRNPYIVIHDIPKLRAFERVFPKLYRAEPVRVAAAARNGAADSAEEAPTGGAMMMSAVPPPQAEGGAMMSAQGASGAPKIEGEMPPLTGATGWLNSKPLTTEGLRGKVVVVDFWTYSCINCLRSMPYINAWYEHYKDHGLVILGVHSPEFAFEKDTDNVRQAVQKFSIAHPVALDSELAIWKAFNNRFWPAKYFVDAQGRIRGHHFGEGKYARSERLIRQLLTEAGANDLPDPLDYADGAGVAAPADTANVASPETYLGFHRAENFSSPGGFVRSEAKDYALPAKLALNQWALAGRWNVGAERSVLAQAPGRVVFRFRARDLHLVLGPGADRKPVRFRVLLDGKPPAGDAGMDVDAEGKGVVREQRLYQLIRQKGGVEEHEFTIEFLDPAVEAYSFTFG